MCQALLTRINNNPYTINDEGDTTPQLAKSGTRGPSHCGGGGSREGGVILGERSHR